MMLQVLNCPPKDRTVHLYLLITPPYSISHKEHETLNIRTYRNLHNSPNLFHLRVFDLETQQHLLPSPSANLTPHLSFLDYAESTKPEKSR